MTRLDSIVLRKQCEVNELRQQIKIDKQHLLTKILQKEVSIKPNANFKQALQNSLSLNVIAEVKRKSPSKGILAQIADPAFLAQQYIDGGASALSVLTDQHFFAGSLLDLENIVKVAALHSVPVLRKDFIIDEIQIAQAAHAGASAVICIISILGKKTQTFIDVARSINMDVLVEIHDLHELQIALDCGAEIIGINNRNLNDFSVDTDLALQLVTAIPKQIVKVAESGITEPVLAREYYQAGFDAVLIGEALVKSAAPDKFIRACRDG